MPRRIAFWALLALAGCGPGTQERTHGQAAAPEPVGIRPFRFGQPDVVLLVTGGTNGMLEVCNCAGPMAGGLARRSGLVRSYRAAFANLLLLDTGDVFWIEPNDLRNEYVLKGYAQIGYDAIVPGDQEWAAGPRRLRELLAGRGLTCLSPTVSAEGVRTIAAMERQFGPAKLAVVADARKSAFTFVPEDVVAKLSFADPAELHRRVGELKAGGYVVVAAAHMDEDSLASLASMPVDLIVRGHTTRSEPQLQRIGGKPVVKVGGSETVGVVAMKLADGKLADIEYRLEVVDTSWPLDQRLIQTYQAYAHAAMRQALDAERKEGLAYQPSSACGRCHRPQYDAWRKSHHARAYGTLVKARRTGDPNCLACHTSGFGTKHGFLTIEKTPELANVNCQDCHRFTEAEHRQKGFRFAPVGKDVCTTCHTPVTDPKFDLSAKVPKVRCPHSARPAAGSQPS